MGALAGTCHKDDSKQDQAVEEHADKSGSCPSTFGMGSRACGSGRRMSGLGYQNSGCGTIWVSCK